MDIGLCMTVKNEEAQLEACLADIIDLFAHVVIIDTGSTDGTIPLLADRFGIEARQIPLDKARCNTLSDARNQGYAALSTPWVMCLDADERIPRDGLERVVKWPNDQGPGGFFHAWITSLPDGHIVEDYKLSLFRKGLEKRGLVHDNPQPSLREAGATAIWTDAFEILHYPAAARLPEKDAYYKWRLDQAIEMQPHWIRYHWFRGLLLQRMGEVWQARDDFAHAFESRSLTFPVECLNAGMALAGLQAKQGETVGALKTVSGALTFLHAVAADFEVSVNFRLRPWFERALVLLENGEVEKVVPYDFAHGRPVHLPSRPSPH